MKRVFDSIRKLFISSKPRTQNKALAGGYLPRGGNVGDFLPLFKGRDQTGRKVKSEELPGRVSKLIFLSDSCGSCIEVLKQLASHSQKNHFLVLKSDPEPYSDADLGDISYKFPILRSSKIVEMFGIQRVPTVVTVNAEGRIQSVDELADPGQLGSCLEPFSPTWPKRDQGLPLGSLFPEFAINAGDAEGMVGKDGAVVLFLSTDCLSCLDIISKLNSLLEPWSGKRTILYIQGEEFKVKNLLRQYRITLPFYLYGSDLRETFKTSVFPYFYLLSGDGYVLSKGTVRDAKGLEALVNMQKNPMPAVEKGGQGA
ncbi:TlpA family protein disulfide reductase [Fontibacillus sp. BL9]|uniref:TlpA family protein disulfide reductase n=1 Tax=Fontibacillus sp. BL9 TaxID=3389971 RepID=UPI00397D8A45